MIRKLGQKIQGAYHAYITFISKKITIILKNSKGFHIFEYSP